MSNNNTPEKVSFIRYLNALLHQTGLAMAYTRLWALIQKEFVVIFMDKGTRKILVMPIVIQSLLFGYGASFNLEQVPYTLYQESFDRTATEVVQRINNNSTFSLVRFCTDTPCIRQSIDRGEALLGLYIARDFNRTHNILVVTDARNTASANTAAGYLQQIISQYNSEIADRKGNTVSLARGGPEITHRFLFNPNNITRYGILTGMILALSMIQVMMLASLSVSREREEGTFDMMLMAPLTPVEILIGKAIPPTLIAIAQGMTLFLICVLWFDIGFQGSFAALFTVMTIFSLCTVGIGLTISALSSTAQQSIVMSFTFILPTIILSGLITPLEAMPDFMQHITLINPFYYGLEAVHRIYLESQTFAQIFHLLLPLIALGIITMGCAVWLFRGKLG